jgi:hypothetical protein
MLLGGSCWRSTPAFLTAALSPTLSLAEQALLIAAGSLSCAASLVLVVRAALLAFLNVSDLNSFLRALLATGTYLWWSEVFQAAASLALLVYGCLLCSGQGCTPNVLTLWALLAQAAHVFQVLHGSNAMDVAASLRFNDAEWSSDPTLPPAIVVDDVLAVDAEEWRGANMVGRPYEVIIVGGGPAGLTAANNLGQLGVRVLLLDKKESVVPDSRFVVVNSATAEGLHRLGVLQQLCERGQPTHFGWGASLSSGMVSAQCVCVSPCSVAPLRRGTTFGCSARLKLTLATWRNSMAAAGRRSPLRALSRVYGLPSNVSV